MESRGNREGDPWVFYGCPRSDSRASTSDSRNLQVAALQAGSSRGMEAQRNSFEGMSWVLLRISEAHKLQANLKRMKYLQDVDCGVEHSLSMYEAPGSISSTLHATHMRAHAHTLSHITFMLSHVSTLWSFLLNLRYRSHPKQVSFRKESDRSRHEVENMVFSTQK